MKMPDSLLLDDSLKRARVQQMKWLALALLISMLVVLLLSAAYRAAHPWLAWTYAFAEAAAVGAIADWFAVTALFRHPLGLPIPHTSIIPRNKDRIGESLGRFVEQNFLTPDNVIAKLAERNIARTIADWLAEKVNSRDVAIRACSLIPPLIQKLDDDDVRRFLDQVVTSQLERLDVARATGHILDVLTAANRHQQLLDQGLKALDTWLSGNRALIKEKFGEASLYTPGFLDTYIVNRFVDGILNLLHEIAEDPGHEMRRRFDLATRDFIHELKTSDIYRKRGRELAHQILAHLQQGNYYRSLWRQVTQRIVDDIAAPNSALVDHVAGALVAAASALREDDALQRKLNAWSLGALQKLMLRHRRQVSLLISDVVRSWDAKEVSAKVEMEIGRDLQYIRLNGTFVGGVVGVVLHGAVQLTA
jgi:uncharacterized membrane-anchored protein YjiN (DUF445 family)